MLVSIGMSGRPYLEVTLLMQHHPEVVVHVGVPRVELDRAACEATASKLEDAMKHDKHKGGKVARLTLLASMCDGIEKRLPAEMDDPDDESNPKVVHFMPGSVAAMGNQDPSYADSKYPPCACAAHSPRPHNV